MKLRPYLAVVLGVALFLAPELLGVRRMGGGPLTEWTTPVWAYAHERMAHQQLPLWNPYLFCGLPLIGHPACGVYYPLNWLAWCLSPGQAIPLSVFLHLVLAGCGAMALLSHYGCRTAVAAAGGLAVAVGGVLPAACLHLEQLQVWSWWPWLLLCVESDHPLLAALVVGVQGLAADPFDMQVSGVATLVWMLVSHSRREDSVSVLGNALGIAVLGLGVAAVQWLPYADLYQHSVRSLGGVEAPLGVTGRDLVHLLLPGAVALVLALVALVGSQARSALAGWVAAAVALVMAFGLNGPAGWVGTWLSGRAQPVVVDPGFGSEPSKSQFVFQVLAHGWRSLVGDEPWRWFVVAGLVLAVLAGLGLEAAFKYRRQAGWAVLGLHLVVAMVWGRMVLPSVTSSPWQPPADVISALQPLEAGPTSRRYAVAGRVEPSLYNFGCLVHAADAVGISAMVPTDTMNVLNFAAFNRLIDVHDRSTLLTGGHRIDSNGLNDAVLRALSVDTVLFTAAEDRPIQIRHVADSVARVRVVARFQTYSRQPTSELEDLPMPMDGEEQPSPQTLATAMLETLATPNHHPAQEVLLDQEPPLGPQDEHPPTLDARATLTPDTPEHFFVDVVSNRKALLVVADAYNEGWLASVNGVRERVLPADGMMRAVVVPSGRSKVEWTFDPPSFAAGWQLSLAFLASIAGLAIRDRLPKRKRPSISPDTTQLEV